jgi:hypothetical protein
VERDGVENFDLRTVLNDESLDDVEAIQFGATLSDIRQVPSSRWGRTTNAPLSIQSSSPFQDPTNRANTGNTRVPPSNELVVDGPSPETHRGRCCL